MKQSVCLIDDRLPLADEQVKGLIKEPNRKIHSSEIDLLLDVVPVDRWEEKELNSLLAGLRKDGNYKLAAFSNPEFFFNHNEYEEEYRPQIVILDWDFGSSLAKPTKDHLKELLEFSFSLICVFTGKDNKHTLDELINSQEFKKYNKRIFVFHKDEANAVEELKKIINENEQKNFSFSFGQKLRSDSAKAADKILVDLGKITINQLGVYLTILDGNTRDFVDFITERYRATISSNDYSILEKLQLEANEDADGEIAKAVWAYRLYNKPPASDDRVMFGDIIKSNNEYCLVITAACDLAKFWSKNNGFLNVVPLHKMEQGNEGLKARFTLTKPGSEVKLDHWSLSTNPSGLSTGSFILPFVPVTDNENLNLYGFAKEFKSIRIGLPSHLETWKQKQAAQLKYGNLPGGAIRLASLSEPFLTPIIQHILSSIAGYGAPDYPLKVSKLIIDKAKEVLS